MAAEAETKPSDPVALFGAITADLAVALADADIASELIWQGEGEIKPEHAEFVYQPPPKAKPSASGAAAGPIDVPAHVRESLPPNASCTLCRERMYPVRQFKREGRLPILILHHAGPAPGAKVRPDRSARFVLGSPEEDDVFARMLKAAGLDFDGPHFQEFPACHFNAERSTQPDWQRRATSCLKHVAHTVTTSGIRLILACGHAAVALLGEEKAM
ncbi:MAG: hypothetical protein HY042_08535, partial [Spirochaetia bacterium]|nr:hypothetical protein [Spirochaetia bacterium]